MKKNAAKINWKSAITFIIVLFIVGCNPKETNTVISGTLLNSQKLKLRLLEMDTRAMVPVDSLTIGADCKLNFNLKITDAGFRVLQAESGKVLAFTIHPGDHIEITGNATDFPENVIVKGSNESEALHSFYQQTWQEEKRVDSIEDVIADHQEDTDYYQITLKMDTLLKTIWERQRAKEISYITQNSKKLSSLLVLNYAFGMNPVLDPQEDFIYYRMLDSTLMMEYPQNKHVLYHHDRVIERKLKQ